MKSKLLEQVGVALAAVFALCLLSILVALTVWLVVSIAQAIP